MPDSITLSPPSRAAHPDHIKRKCRAAGAFSGRKLILAQCKAEIDWASARYRREHQGPRPFDHEMEWEAAQARMPHEQAAAVVLNVWGHLLVPEARIHALVAKLRQQRAAGWYREAAGTVDDLRYYWQARHTSWRVMLKAIADYRAARRAVDYREAA